MRIRLPLSVAVAGALSASLGFFTSGPAAAAPTVADAEAFVAKAEADLAADSDFQSRAGWVQATYITSDTNWIVAKIGADSTDRAVRYAKEAARFNDVKVDGVTARKLYLLKQGLVLPASSRPGASQELADIAARLDTDYSTAKFTYNGRTLTLDDMESLLRTSRDPNETRALWEGWRAVSAPQMTADYKRLVELANEGARELGYADTGALWRSWYDMPPGAFATKTDALWNQVTPLYGKLECYVRARLNQKYGSAVQPPTGPIRADLLGNMWSQHWGNIYDLVQPKDASLGYDLTAALVAHGYDAAR
jgi:peptidyl-dipeptidase A